MLNQSYVQDKNGNVQQRQNSNPPGLTESFNYDADNRLTCVALASTCTKPTMTYDSGAAGPGNIKTQAGVGTYAYPAAGQPRPHAVSSINGSVNGIVNPVFSYDANGNMTARASATQNIYWSSYDYPTSIAGTDATGAETVALTYGPDRQRWKQVYTAPGTTETTYYVGNFMDLVFGASTSYRHYIYAGKEPVAVYIRTSTGSITMNYLMADHQGGIASIVSSSGALEVNESFSAFGTRRDPSSWSGAPPTADLNTIAGISRQGYTFQTALGQSMGLNHMNGRVEDAILGRFLSPDPTVPDPLNAQSYNSYSYTVNNPASRVDPTGFDDNPSCYSYGPNQDGQLGIWDHCGGSGGQPPALPQDPELPPIFVCASCSSPPPPPWPVPPGFLDPPTPPQNPNPFPGGGTPQTPNLPTSRPSPPQSPPPNQPTQPPPLCTATRAANPNAARNIGYGAAVGGIGVGLLAAINIVGFPEVEVIEGIGSVLGALSAFGDPGLVVLSYGTYGATAFGIAGFAATPAVCGP